MPEYLIMELTNMPKVAPHSCGGKWQISVEFDVDKWRGGLAPIYCFFPVDIEHHGGYRALWDRAHHGLSPG